jgi:hypothetical protein
MDSNDVIETAHAFPHTTIIGVHNHGWPRFTQSTPDLAFAFNALGTADRLATLMPAQPMPLPSHVIRGAASDTSIASFDTPCFASLVRTT